MTKVGFFMRFTAIYSVILAVGGVIAGSLGVDNASVLNTPILLVVAFKVFYAYSDKNGRILKGREKWLLISLALLGDVITSLLLGIPAILAHGLPVSFFLFGFIIVIPLHLLLFIAVNYGVKKAVIKQRPELQPAAQ